jgi:hypothetical protein
MVLMLIVQATDLPNLFFHFRCDQSTRGAGINVIKLFLFVTDAPRKQSDLSNVLLYMFFRQGTYIKVIHWGRNYSQISLMSKNVVKEQSLPRG